MTQISTPDACHTCGFVDNETALPTTPQVPFRNPKRTFDLFYPADIFTRRRHPERQSSLSARQPLDRSQPRQHLRPSYGTGNGDKCSPPIAQPC